MSHPVVRSLYFVKTEVIFNSFAIFVFVLQPLQVYPAVSYILSQMLLLFLSQISKSANYIIGVYGKPI